MDMKPENYRRALRRQSPSPQQLNRVWGRLSTAYDELNQKQAKEEKISSLALMGREMERKTVKMDKRLFMSEKKHSRALISAAAMLTVLLCAGLLLRSFMVERQQMIPFEKRPSAGATLPGTSENSGALPLPQDFPAGRWVPENKEGPFPPVICFNADMLNKEAGGDFVFERGLAFSYVPKGHYELKGNEIVLEFNGKEEGKLRFRWEEGRMTVLETNVHFPYSTEGTVWTYFGENTGNAWEGMEQPSLLLNRLALREDWCPIFENDPVYLANPIEEESRLPEQLPVYAEKGKTGRVSEKQLHENLSEGLKRLAEDLKLELDFSQLRPEEAGSMGVCKAACSVPSKDGSLILLAAKMRAGTQYCFFPTDPNAYTKTWPVGYAFNPNPKYEGTEFERVNVPSLNGQELLEELNRDPERRKAAVDAFYRKAADEAAEAAAEWESILPWKGRQKLSYRVMRSSVTRDGMLPLAFIFDTFPASGAGSAYPRLPGEPLDALGQALWNSGLRKVSWLLDTELVENAAQGISLEPDFLPVPQRLHATYLREFKLNLDASKRSHARVIGFSIDDMSEIYSYVGTYPLRSLEDAEKSVAALIKEPAQGEYTVQAVGMSYQENKVNAAAFGSRYLIPAYDFVLLLKSAEPELSFPWIRVYISVPAIHPDYLEYVGKRVNGCIEIENEEGKVVATMAFETKEDGGVVASAYGELTDENEETQAKGTMVEITNEAGEITGTAYAEEDVSAEQTVTETLSADGSGETTGR